MTSPVDTSAPDTAKEPGPLAQKYWLTISTPTEDATDENVRAVLSSHLAWIDEIDRGGSLFMAGPLLSGPAVSTGAGVIVLRAGDEAEARAISERDPLVAAGLCTFALYQWLLNDGSVSLTVSLGRGTYDWS